MKIFIDTSSLLKKYYVEEGSAQILTLFKKATEVTVSPITYVELYNAVQRLHTERIITKQDLTSLLHNIHADFQFFQKINWDQQLEHVCISLINKYTLKSLDCVQLAAAQSSGCGYFVTSDHKQYKIAVQEFKKAVLI